MLAPLQPQGDCEPLMQLIPLFRCRWAKGNVVLLGDSAHAMQPNLGQGGCMAIEDGFQLAKDLARKNEEASGAWFDVEKVLVVGTHTRKSECSLLGTRQIKVFCGLCIALLCARRFALRS